MRRTVSHLAARPWDAGLAAILLLIGILDLVGNIIPPEVGLVGIPDWTLHAYGAALAAGGALILFAIVQPCSVERAVLTERAGHTLLAPTLTVMGAVLLSQSEHSHIVGYVGVMCLTAGAGSAARAVWLSGRIRDALRPGGSP